jgi:phage terminase large subunit
MKVVRAKVTRVFRSNLNSEKTIIVNEGGTRSGKSYALTQLFIYKSHTERNKKFLITRKFSRTLFYSTYNLFIELMRKYGLFEDERLNKTQKVYTTPTNSVIYFLGVDDFEKLKSTEFNYIFIEEATEFDFEDFIVLYNHLSAPSEDGQKNKIYLAFNPDYPPTHWIATELPKFDADWIKSNFYDNPFLDAETRSRIESLKYIDETLYLIYGLGQRAEVKELVFPAFEIVDEPEGNLIAYGLDWGYNNPTAIVAVYVGDDFWCADELFYRSFATIEEIHYFIAENLKPSFNPSQVQFTQDRSKTLTKPNSHTKI